MLVPARARTTILAYIKFYNKEVKKRHEIKKNMVAQRKARTPINPTYMPRSRPLMNIVPIFQPKMRFNQDNAFSKTFLTPNVCSMESSHDNFLSNDNIINLKTEMFKSKEATIKSQRSKSSKSKKQRSRSKSKSAHRKRNSQNEDINSGKSNYQHQDFAMSRQSLKSSTSNLAQMNEQANPLRGILSEPNMVRSGDITTKNKTLESLENTKRLGATG